MYKLFAFLVVLNITAFAVDIPAPESIAYSIDEIGCASSNRLSDIEACKKWRAAAKNNNIGHIFCKRIWLSVAEGLERRLTCTPAIMNYHDTIIYLQFVELGLKANGGQNLQVLVNYTGMSDLEHFIWTMFGIIVFFALIALVCLCDVESAPPRRYERHDGASNFTNGLIIGNAWGSSGSRRRTPSTGGWSVAGRR